MLDKSLIEFLVGTVTILGALVLLLNKFNLLHFGKKEITTMTCPAHTALIKKVDDIHDQQIEDRAFRQVQSEKLEEGKEQFEKIQKSMNYFGRAIAVLLDRSGGIPKKLGNGGDLDV